MMRHYFILSVIGLWSLLGVATTHAQLSTIENTSPSITQSINQVFDSSNIDNPLRQGSLFAVQSPDGKNTLDVINVGEILGFGQAKNNIIILIQMIINVLLSFMALIALIYLIFEGYKMVVAGSNEDQYKEAFSKLKNAAIAIIGIALSRFIISFIFFIIDTILT